MLKIQTTKKLCNFATGGGRGQDKTPGLKCTDQKCFSFIFARYGISHLYSKDYLSDAVMLWLHWTGCKSLTIQLSGYFHLWRNNSSTTMVELDLKWDHTQSLDWGFDAPSLVYITSYFISFINLECLFTGVIINVYYYEKQLGFFKRNVTDLKEFHE